MAREAKGVQVSRRVATAVRERIQLSSLVKALQDHALHDRPMSPTRIDAAKFLINKKMPNAPERREITGADGVPLAMKVTFVDASAE